MNAFDFQDKLQLMAHCNLSLSEYESRKIEYSLITLKQKSKLKEIYFFGRINTRTQSVYYVAFGHKSDALEDQKFFYSVNAHEWLSMQEVETSILEYVPQIQAYFTGDPGHFETLFVVNSFIIF
jgi:hypothetical protein